MKKILIVLGILLLTTACGESKEDKTVQCKMDSGSSQVVNEVKISYDEDKKPTKILVTQDAALMDFYFEEYEDIADLEKEFEKKYVNQKEKQPGMEVDVSIDEKKKKLHVEIEIDPEKVKGVDMEKLTMGDYKTVENIVESLKSEGFTCGKIK